jgi:hypothetical protein
VRQLPALFTLAALAALAAPGAAAQGRWTPDIGFQAGMTRVKPAGTGLPDQVDGWDLPGDGSSYGTLFAIIPVTRRLAVEPSVSASQFSFGDAAQLFNFAAGTNVTLGLRGNIAIVSGLYVAVGGAALYAESGGTHSQQLGVVAAVGYRVHVRPRVAVRLEAQGTSMRRSDIARPFNVYALLLGVSGGAGRDRGKSDSMRAAAAARRWRPAVGIAGGYARNHVHGSAFGLSIIVDETRIALPGSGSTVPPALYAVIPLRGRFAVETGFDAHRTSRSDSVFTSAHVSARVNVALHGGWYAAGGGNARYIAQTGTRGFALAGAHVATGYRFPLVGELGGRVELSYTAFKERWDFPFAQNVVALMFGVTLPLQ